MKRLLFIIGFIAIYLNINAQYKIDVVYLNNGNKVKGKIIESSDKNFIKIKSADNTISIFRNTDIENVTQEDSDVFISPDIPETPKQKNDKLIKEKQEEIKKLYHAEGMNSTSIERLGNDIVHEKIPVSKKHDRRRNSYIGISNGISGLTIINKGLQNIGSYGSINMGYIKSGHAGIAINCFANIIGTEGYINVPIWGLGMLVGPMFSTNGKSFSFDVRPMIGFTNIRYESYSYRGSSFITYGKKLTVTEGLSLAVSIGVTFRFQAWKYVSLFVNMDAMFINFEKPSSDLVLKDGIKSNIKIFPLAVGAAYRF